MDGRFWIPYQLSGFPAPPFPEFISGNNEDGGCEAKKQLGVFIYSVISGEHKLRKRTSL